MAHMVWGWSRVMPVNCNSTFPCNTLQAGALTCSQGAQYPLTKEYSLNCTRVPTMLYSLIKGYTAPG